MNKKKIEVPAFVGVAAVWFGTHVGPGTASGNQTASYFGEYGKAGLIGGLIAMLLLGICIYYCLEYSRLIGTTNFKEFANSFFHPYEKIFGTIFEFAFLWMVVMNFSSSLATGATSLESQLKIPYWGGIMLLCALTIILTMFGAKLVRNSTTVLTALILIALIVLLICGLSSPESGFIARWNGTMALPATLPKKPWYEMIWSAIVYAGFLVVGMMGTSLSVSDTLKSKKDSRRAATLGILLNTGLICMVAILLYAYPAVLGEFFNPARTSTTFIPNLEVVQVIGVPILTYFYVVILIAAIISTLEGYGFGVIARYRNFIPLRSERAKDFFTLILLLIIGILVSNLGLDWIVKTGFRIIGYVEIIFIVVPTLLIGHKKVKEMTFKKTQPDE